jgi:hypothetical protein
MDPPPMDPPHMDPPPHGERFVVSRTYNAALGERSIAYREVIDPGYAVDGPTFEAFDTEQPGTNAIYDCRRGRDRFVSLDPGCEGGTLVSAGAFGWIYAGDGEGRHIVLRCLAPGGDLFVSQEPSCEGYPSDGLLGFF